MPRDKCVRVIIGVDGKCSVDAVRFTDSSCLKATKEILDAIGGQVEREITKPQARVREGYSNRQREVAR